MNITFELLLVMGANLLGIGIAYGMLHAEQKAIKAMVLTMREDFNARISELKQDFGERNAELRSDVMKGRERIHQLTDEIMAMSRVRSSQP